VGAWGGKTEDGRYRAKTQRSQREEVAWGRRGKGDKILCSLLNRHCADYSWGGQSEAGLDNNYARLKTQNADILKIGL
jgi:hypothetical protein